MNQKSQNPNSKNFNIPPLPNMPSSFPYGIELSDQDFKKFQKKIYELSGIHMSDVKKALIAGRLLKRLRHYNLKDYGEYYKMIDNPANKEEERVMVNLLTTNVTHFFRESQHFDYLTSTLLPEFQKSSSKETFRVWSAASSSGEEPYTIAMVLAEFFGAGGNWEILGSDINETMISDAGKAVYSMDKAQSIPPALFKKYCSVLKEGDSDKFTIQESLRRKVKFQKVNLIQKYPHLGSFNLIFVRNVLIYFDIPTKQKIIADVATTLKKDGYLLVGHSESLETLQHTLKLIKPTVYKKNEN